MFEHLFHLARRSGGFTYYGAIHRLPALYYMDFGFLALLVAAATLASLLILLLPALRERRSTLFLGMTMIGTGSAIGYCLLIPEWQVGSLRLANTSMSYWPGSPRQNCTVALGIGLTGANVTLSCDATPALYYNEHLGFDEQVSALRRGLMPPLLSVMTPLSAGCFYARRAGHWTYCVLCFSIALWMYTVILLAALPHRAGDALLSTGCLLQLGAAVYHILQDGFSTPTPHGMKLHYGPCLWVCLGFGLLTSVVGVYLGIMGRRNVDHCLTTFYVETYEKCCEEPRTPCSELRMETETSPYLQATEHTKD